MMFIRPLQITKGLVDNLTLFMPKALGSIIGGTRLSTIFSFIETFAIKTYSLVTKKT